jgi:ribonuclease HI
MSMNDAISADDQPILPVRSDCLTEAEREELRIHEETIGRNFQAFLDVGQALAAIRDQRLYRETHGTFEAYCRDTWAFSRQRAYELMGAAEVVHDLRVSAIADTEDIPLPLNEAQARPLTKVPVEERPLVWRHVVEEAKTSGETITGKRVKEAVDRRRPRMVAVEPKGPARSVPPRPEVRQPTIEDPKDPFLTQWSVEPGSHDIKGLAAILRQSYTSEERLKLAMGILPAKVPEVVGALVGRFTSSALVGELDRRVKHHPVHLWLACSCRGAESGLGVQGAGAVCMVGPRRWEWSIPLGHVPIREAELVAIREALLRLDVHPRRDLVIYTTSEFPLQALGERPPASIPPGLVQEIRESVGRFQRCRVRHIKSRSTPYHKRACQLARAAARS